MTSYHPAGVAKVLSQAPHDVATKQTVLTNRRTTTFIDRRISRHTSAGF
jgi:hypothetical protein